MALQRGTPLLRADPRRPCGRRPCPPPPAHGRPRPTPLLLSSPRLPGAAGRGGRM